MSRSALRRGPYRIPLTFTLSTTNP
jgi:hypothetical protein